MGLMDNLPEELYLVARELSKEEVAADPVDPNFLKADEKEWWSFIDNKVFKIIKRKNAKNILRWRKVHTYKHENPDDSEEITRRKTRVVVMGF